MDEILRALFALQVSDEQKVALPLDWNKGDLAIVPPPKTLMEMQDRIDGTFDEKIDFYLVKKKVEV
jgi:peroxiredoxin (alkyl hydroperoxide reductase subunit C)